jgi:hypothetical protein
MVQAVVDDLKSIDIHEQDRKQKVFLPLSTFDCTSQAVHEKRPVGKSGQAVMEGIVEQLLLGALAFIHLMLEPVMGLGVVSAVAA